MPLTEKRIGELAMFALQENLENDGKLKLMPSQVKGGIKNIAKKTKISEREAAEFMKLLLENSYVRTIAELDKIINSEKV